MLKLVGIIGLMLISLRAQYRNDWDTAYLAGHLMRGYESEDSDA